MPECFYFQSAKNTEGVSEWVGEVQSLYLKWGGSETGQEGRQGSCGLQVSADLVGISLIHYFFPLRDFFWGLLWFGATHTKWRSSPPPVRASKQCMWAMEDSHPCLLPASLDKMKPKARRGFDTVRLQYMLSLAALREPAQNWGSVDLSAASSYWPLTCQHADASEMSF